MDPLVFTSHARPQIWGHRRLEGLGKTLPEGTFGEAWEISAHPYHQSRVAEGPLTGQSLADLWRERGEEIHGRAGHTEAFPLLIKYLDCHLQLSVQVHPTDVIAAQLLPGERGKTEAWVVLSVEPDARIYAGLLAGVTPEDLQRHLDAGTVHECLHSFVPKPGDCLFLPAGVVHAVGGGVLMAEVQQSSDATFRLYDWNRRGPDGQPRALHVDQSLASIDWQAGPANPLKPVPMADPPGKGVGEHLARCQYFELDRFQPAAPLQLVDGEWSIWLVLDGEAELVSDATGYRRKFQRGDSVLVPAVAAGLHWSVKNSPATPTLLRAQVPSEG